MTLLSANQNAYIFRANDKYIYIYIYKVLYIFRKLNSSGFQNYIAFLYLYIIYENINRKP